MSLGTKFEWAINDAVNAAVFKGVCFGVSAGNDNSLASKKSPATAVMR